MSLPWDIRWPRHTLKCLENKNTSWSYSCFSQKSISIDTAPSNISFHGEWPHWHPESISKGNASILETNICWAPMLQLPYKADFQKKIRPIYFFQQVGIQWLKSINAYLWFTLSLWFRNINWQIMNDYNTFWRLHYILKPVKIIVSEKWKKTAYLSKWAINLSLFKPEGKILIIISKLL